MCETRKALPDTGQSMSVSSEYGKRTGVEYPHRESVCFGMADVAVVLGGGERPRPGKGRHGRTQPAQETSAGHAGLENRKLLPDMQGWRTGTNLNVGKSNAGSQPDTEASPTERASYEEKLHAGICAGGAG